MIGWGLKLALEGPLALLHVYRRVQEIAIAIAIRVNDVRLSKTPSGANAARSRASCTRHLSTIG